MSMELTSSRTDEQPNLRFYIYLFARIVRNRRRELGMTVTRAAQLSGMEVSQWWAIEAGWVPTEYKTIRTIAATLEMGNSNLDLASILSSLAQEQSVL